MSERWTMGKCPECGHGFMAGPLCEHLEHGQADYIEVVPASALKQCKEEVRVVRNREEADHSRMVAKVKEREAKLAQCKEERDEAREEYESERAQAIGYSWEASEWKHRAESAEAKCERLEGALEEISAWDAGWNLDYRQHFLNLQGIASAALSIPKTEGER